MQRDRPDTREPGFVPRKSLRMRHNFGHCAADGGASRSQNMRRFRSMLISSACVLLPGLAAADEGMWTYDHFPSATVRQKYGVEITPQWLDRVRLATVRLANCTATFVSRDGLILTNHHCIDACLAENSSREKSLIEDGFLAATRPQELRCGAQLADVLVAMEDVTAKVDAATRGMDGTNAKQARRQTLTALESACEKAAAADRKAVALKCQAVTLYAGGQYFLYKYRRYSDVRLVFAPEGGIANFGGDPDNFQFPRWNLDMGVLRAYENGKPARIANPLHIDFAGPAAGEMVLVSGHPGSTDRLLTVAQLDLQRDTALPQALMRGSELRGRYIQFAKSGEAARRIVQEPLDSLENSIKVRRRQLDALLDGALIAQKQRDEADLRSRVAARPELAQLGSAWTEIEAATQRGRELYTPYAFLEGGAAFNSRLFSYARLLVRAADERTRADGDRLREYTDTRLPRLQQQLSATIPVYPEVERLTLSFGLERMREWLGPDNATVRRLLASDSPDTLAGRLVEGSQLGDPAVRLALWNGGAAAIAASSDPMIQLARSVDAEARAIRTRFENEVEAPEELAEEASHAHASRCSAPTSTRMRLSRCA